MNEEVKPLRWRYVPCIIAALLVAGSITYFNLTPWEYPYFAIARDFGWPLGYRHESIIIYGADRPESHDNFLYPPLTANIALGAVMTIFVTWGAWFLQRINRSLFRVHLQTLVMLVLVISVLMLLNTQEFSKVRVYGWPHDAIAYWNDSDAMYPPCWLNIGKNAFVALYALFFVTLLSESWLAWRARVKTKV